MGVKSFYEQVVASYFALIANNALVGFDGSASCLIPLNARSRTMGVHFRLLPLWRSPFYDNLCTSLRIPADTARFVYDAVTGEMKEANNRYARVRRSYYPGGALKSDSTALGFYDTANCPGIRVSFRFLRRLCSVVRLGFVSPHLSASGNQASKRTGDQSMNGDFATRAAWQLLDDMTE